MKFVCTGMSRLKIRMKIAVAILCVQLFALLSLYVSDYSIIINSNREQQPKLFTVNSKELESVNKVENDYLPAENITLSDELNADIYSVDYQFSHPLDNECRFPVLIKDEPDLLYTVDHYIEVECPLPRNHILVEQLHTGELLVGRRYLSTKKKDFKCYAQELTGSLRPKNTELKFTGNYIELPFNKRFFVEKDQFHVQCKDSKGKVIFADAFTNIPYKKRLNPPKLDGTMNFSVSVLILDSISRNQFFRHAPQTLKFMKEQGFQILHGYNKVADNSAVNLIPLLAGKTFDLKKHGVEHLIRKDMELTEQMIEDDAWKYLDMIPKLMKDRGCATLWNDDIMVPRLGLFNYDAFKGFQKPIADYLFRPYYQYLYKKQNARKGCVNGHLITRRMIEIWGRFAIKYARKCHFGFSFLTALTHDNSNSVELLDQTIYDGLLRMKYKSVFDNTVLIIMGDHGQRMSRIQNTYSGRIEERMPLFSIYIPKKYRLAYPEKFHNFIVNKNRFVSNYDLHETLRELLGFTDNERKPVGLSLFHEIPKHRNCNDTRIPHNHCMCQEKLDQSFVSKDIQSKMFFELKKYIKHKTDRLKCLSNVNVKLPKRYTPYTISAQARMGVRFPSMWEDLLKKEVHYNSSMNEILDVEFDVNVDIKTNNDEERSFTLRSRMLYHKNTGYIRLIAKPLLKLQKCSQIYIIDDLCSCLNG